MVPPCTDLKQHYLLIPSTTHRVQLLFPATGSETFTCMGSPMTSIDEDFNHVNLLTHCEIAKNSDLLQKALAEVSHDLVGAHPVS